MPRDRYRSTNRYLFAYSHFAYFRLKKCAFHLLAKNTFWGGRGELHVHVGRQSLFTPFWGGRVGEGKGGGGVLSQPRALWPLHVTGL